MKRAAGPIDYYTLMSMREAFIRTCKQHGLCPNQTECLRADEYFTKRAVGLGWISHDPTDINV